MEGVIVDAALSSGVRVSRRRFRAVALGVVAVALAVGSVQAPAHAAKKPAPSLVATANGVVGIPQTIEVRAPRFAGQTVPLTISLPGGPALPVQATLNGSGSGSAVWTPTDSGVWTVSGTGTFASAASSQAVVAPVTTQTTLFAGSAVTGLPTNLRAVVTSNTGTLSPLGAVQFTNQFGNLLGQVGLTPTSAGQSSATLSWTPSAAGTATIIANYIPAWGAAGANNALSSNARQNIAVTSEIPLLSLAFPSTFQVGTATQLTVNMNNPQLTGTVAFSLNTNGVQSGISGSVPLVNGAATVPWTPTTAGNQIVTVQFSATNSNTSGQISQIIAPLPQPPADPMSVAPVGGTPWSVTTPIAMTVGQQLTFNVTTGSGAGVSISESGPCLVSGTTLISSLAPGQCTLTVTSPGNGSSLGSQTVEFTVGVAAAPKRRR